ncbi:hypothetical protein BBK36DRAFT_1143598 [Trichoderma citrinoviride]|uniref:Uncharacterized protein n=1 Tax=Trichoderma citrinoviride TaxID=58853 RepID=A0A2T4B3I3_9HYPO|nr:hypothetical protein BBK36DRAFT_1143598 [Trichoderma citrinoviride]PTB63893.1 hypothetical protein BBK36DRAFT_1143598 [Trichoderma citrinoviride]
MKSPGGAQNGEKYPVVNPLLQGRDGQKLFHMGEQYGLSKKEFDYALTIQSPRRGERIFYPVHVLSRSQATINRWDGNLVKSLSLYTARTMEKYCNKWAVAVTLDEPHAAEAMTYFFATYYCERFARIKRTRPTATREQMLWYNLDR